MKTETISWKRLIASFPKTDKRRRQARVLQKAGVPSPQVVCLDEGGSTDLKWGDIGCLLYDTTTLTGGTAPPRYEELMTVGGDIDPDFLRAVGAQPGFLEVDFDKIIEKRGGKSTTAKGLVTVSAVPFTWKLHVIGRGLVIQMLTINLLLRLMDGMLFPLSCEGCIKVEDRDVSVQDPDGFNRLMVGRTADSLPLCFSYETEADARACAEAFEVARMDMQKQLTLLLEAAAK